jgi:hypothetical protein
MISKLQLWEEGAKYLQKCNTVSNDVLYLHNINFGSKKLPITIGAYGKGKKPKISVSGQYAISIRDSRNLIVKDFILEGASFRTIFILADKSDVYNIKIFNCKIDGQSLKKVSGMHCIQARKSKRSDHCVYNIEIANNLIENAGDTNLNCDGINLSVKHNAYIHHNFIQNNSGNGIDLAGGLNHIIEFNKCLNNAGTKAHGQQYDLENVIIRNNYFVQFSSKNYNSFGVSIQDSKNGKLINNTVLLYNIGMGALILSSPNNSAMFSKNLIKNNLFYGSRKGSATIRIFPELYEKSMDEIKLIDNVIACSPKSYFVFYHQNNLLKKILDTSNIDLKNDYFSQNNLFYLLNSLKVVDKNLSFQFTSRILKILGVKRKNKMGVVSSFIDMGGFIKTL